MGLWCLLANIGCTRNVTTYTNPKTVPTSVYILSALAVLFIITMIIVGILNGAKLKKIPSYEQIGFGSILLVFAIFIGYQMKIHGYDPRNLTEMNIFLKDPIHYRRRNETIIN